MNLPLPKVDCLVYDLELPLSKKKIRFRPFLVKEQRNLMAAMEAGDDETIQRNIHQVLSNCVLTEVEIENLPILDIEYYFLNLRARSVGEVVENRFMCKNSDIAPELAGGLDDKNVKICKHTIKVEFNLLDIKPDREPKNDIIKLNDQMSIKLKYPVFSMLDGKKNLDTEGAFDMIAGCVEYIFDGKQYYYAREYTKEEMKEYLDSLTQQQFDKIEQFFDDIPKLSKKMEFKCGKCGFLHTIEVEGLEGFFG